MNWWTNFWKAPTWLQDVFDRTSWLELIGTFASIVLSVLIALWIQRRDFAKRTAEARNADATRKQDVQVETRRALLEKAFDLVTDGSAFAAANRGGRPDASRQVLINGRVDDVANLMRLDPGPYSHRMKVWFRVAMLSMMYGEVELYEPKRRIVESSHLIRVRLMEWFEEQANPDQFPEWNAELEHEATHGR